MENIESKHIFSTKEKNSIIKNAMILLNIKYNIKLEENLVSQFERLDIEKE